MPRRDDDMPEMCVRHDLIMEQVKTDQNAAAASNAADHQEMKETMNRIDLALRGNGRTGLVTKVSRIQLQVGVLWALMLCGMTVAVGAVVKHFLGESP